MKLSRSVTSSGRPIVPAPSSSAVCSASGAVDVADRHAGALAISAAAVARPIPRAPPVIATTRPASERGALAMKLSSSVRLPDGSGSAAIGEIVGRHCQPDRTGSLVLGVTGRPASRRDAILRRDGPFQLRRPAARLHRPRRGARTTVLMPGLLLSQKMQTPLARSLAKRGNRVVTLRPARSRRVGSARGRCGATRSPSSPSRRSRCSTTSSSSRRSSAAPRSAPTSRSRSPPRRPSGCAG